MADPIIVTRANLEQLPRLLTKITQRTVVVTRSEDISLYRRWFAIMMDYDGSNHQLIALQFPWNGVGGWVAMNEADEVVESALAKKYKIFYQAI